MELMRPLDELVFRDFQAGIRGPIARGLHESMAAKTQIRWNDLTLRFQPAPARPSLAGRGAII
jgi:hypothetical protein